ncbi:hypothetical protein [Bacillus cereus]|uniref:hypothetical protein n=1 Tax=Bacillus cereus TaxID=1396 RepID=UPI000944DE2D|nr:hypothetical protein [Bacillus cereus]
MAWKRILINSIIILLTVAIEVTSAFLGGAFDKPEYLILCIALLFFVIVNLFLANSWLSQKDEQAKLEQTVLAHEKKISTLSIQNNQTGNNFFHVAIRPTLSTGTFLHTNTMYELYLYVNSPYEISRNPDIKLITNKRWKIFCKQNTPEISYSTHNDKFEYSLKGCLDPIIVDKKFYLYKFIVEFTEFAENEFTLLVESREYKSEVNNSIFIRSA